MTDLLTWKYLTPEEVHSCITAPTMSDVHTALRKANDRAINEASMDKTPTARTSIRGSKSSLIKPIEKSSNPEDTATKLKHNNSSAIAGGSSYFSLLCTDFVALRERVMAEKRRINRIKNKRATTFSYYENASSESKTNTIYAHDNFEQMNMSAVESGESSTENSCHVPIKKVKYHQPYATEQEDILLDLYFHLIQYSKELSFTPSKVSTLIGIAAHTHAESMAQHLSMVDSFSILGELLQRHSVHRPPFSSAIFTVDDAKRISEYLLNTYYRHYKMYIYAFTPRHVAAVESFILAEDSHDVPPTPLPQIGAVPLADYEAKVSAQAAQQKSMEEEEEKEARAVEEAILAEEEERLRQLSAIPEGLSAQLESIRNNVLGLSVSKLDQIELQLNKIESRIYESQQAQRHQHSSKVGSGRSHVSRR